MSNPIENIKHEQFARCVAIGNSPYICFFGVFGTEDTVLADRLMDMTHIKDRVQDLREPDADT